MNKVGKKLKMKNCFVVSTTSKSGGLAMLWNSETKVNIISFSNHHIDVEVEIETGKQMRCTRVYEHSETSKKKNTLGLY